MRIHKVTDLRTGLPHFKRDAGGRFVARKQAAKLAEIWDGWLIDTERMNLRAEAWRNAIRYGYSNPTRYRN